jgi:tRNA pseudouridine55 synthase
MRDGILAIHKPAGISSARVVARVKKALGVKKVGHTGTLDPFATGLLLCAVNKGTKISGFFLNGCKRYLARVCLGLETDTYDLTGRPVFTADENFLDDIKPRDIEAAVAGFLGPQDQVPPVFSALKHEGRPLYKLARQGINIRKPSRRIEIFDICITGMDLPHIELEIYCSAGTYIRSIAFDMGRRLGCGAHLSKLCRTQSSAFCLDQAIELEALEGLDRTDALERLIPLSDCLSFMPRITAGPAIAKKISFGQVLTKDELGPVCPPPGEPVRVTDDRNRLLAIIQLNENRRTYNYTCVFSS